MLSILGFLAALGPLVIFHELGHFLFAKLFGVKAEVFSVGFGPKLWAKQYGETEFRLAAIPLGGYVKLLGEEPGRELPPEDLKRSLQRQAPWKRFFIFFGGPLFNFILAALIFMAILAIGEKQPASYIGRVVEGSAAAKAGFVSGDQIVAIDGQPVTKFEEVILAVNESPGREMTFDVVRESAAGAQPQKQAVKITPAPQDGFSVYGEATHVGEIDGMIPFPRANVVGVADPSSIAGRAGVVTGDKVVSFAGAPIESWEQLETLYAKAAPGAELAFEIEPSQRKDRPARPVVALTKPSNSKGLAMDTGLESSELFVERPVPDSPAAAAGIQSGDRILAIGGQRVMSFYELRDAVQRTGEKHGTIDVKWQRYSDGGKVVSAQITPTATETRDPILRKSMQYTIGVIPNLVWAEPKTVVERIWNPVVLAYEGTKRMVEFSRRNIVSIGKMIRGDVSINTLGGPILIGKIAGDSLSRGVIAFLTTMAVLSVGLGVLNILPIPVLDGGHLLLLGIEAIRGKPLSLRQTEIIQQVGLSLIILLMVVVIRNDIARLPFFN